MKDNQDHFNILRKINSKPKATQRELAEELGFSLGKLNYCIRSLNQKGLIKISSFKNKTDKLGHLRRYVLTKKGINHRINLTIKFMQKINAEYNELKKEIQKNKSN